MRRIAIPLAVGLVLVGCRDDGPMTNPPITQPQSVVQLLVSHFSFLPPLASETSVGTFNGSLQPVVEICLLSVNVVPAPNQACAASPFATFTRQGGTKGEQIFVVSNSHYGVDFKTDQYSLPNGTYARISVRSACSAGNPSSLCSGFGGTTFGFAEIYVDAGGKLKIGTDLGYIGVRNGGSLPIKFSMGYGIFCQNQDSSTCFEGTLDSNGGTFTWPNLQGGLRVAPGAVPQGVTANLVFYRYDGLEPCLPTDYPQFKDCVRIYTEPVITLTPSSVLGTFPAILGFCVEPAASALLYGGELSAGKWDEQDVSSFVQSLPSANSTVGTNNFVTNCGGFAANLRLKSAWDRLASSARLMLRPFASVFAPQPLYAQAPGPSTCPPICVYWGMESFSRVGLYRPVTIEKYAGDNQTVLFDGSVFSVVLPVDPTVLVKSTLTGNAAAGVPITFEVLTGGGSVSPTNVDTNNNGLASAQWQLGSLANSLRVRNTPLGVWQIPPRDASFPSQVITSSVTFNARAIDVATLAAIFLPPVGANSGDATKYVGGLTNVAVEVCQLSGTPATCGSTLYTIPMLDGGTKYQGNWNTSNDLQVGGIYRLNVKAGSFTIGYIDIQPLAGGKAKNLTEGTEFNFQIGSTLPLKISIQTP